VPPIASQPADHQPRRTSRQPVGFEFDGDVVIVVIIVVVVAVRVML
jgi:hypothetical protein